MSPELRKLLDSPKREMTLKEREEQNSLRERPLRESQDHQRRYSSILQIRSWTMILQVICVDERKIRYFSIRAEYQDAVKAVDGHHFQQMDQTDKMDTFVQLMGGEVDFMEKVSIGEEVDSSSLLRDSNITTFWYD
jgi:hypothetical protein